MEAISNAELRAETSATDLTMLVDGMSLGNEAALEALYEATVGKLFALASAMLRNAQDAEDIVCMTYAHAWANAARYDATRGSVLGWLLMLCRSRALDRLRQRRESRVSEPVELENIEADDARPDDLLDLLQRHSAVRVAVAKLSPVRRRLVSFAFLQGLSHPEIATATGMALGTVKSHLRRALLQLKQELEGV